MAQTASWISVPSMTPHPERRTPTFLAIGRHYTAEGRRRLLLRRVQRAGRDGSRDGPAEVAGAGRFLPLGPEFLGRQLAHRLDVLDLDALVLAGVLLGLGEGMVAELVVEADEFV